MNHIYPTFLSLVITYCFDKNVYCHNIIICTINISSIIFSSGPAMTKNLIYRWTSISIPFGELATCLGDVAYCEELVDNLDNANNASGKFGGVAGVLAGAHNCNKKLKGFITKKYNGKNTYLLTRFNRF